MPETETFNSPSAGELDCLAVLWNSAQMGEPVLRLTEIHRRVCDRRKQHGEPAAALTTVSTHLRSLVNKRLLAEASITDAGEGVESTGLRVRGMLSPATRRTGYQAACEAGKVLGPTFKALASAYPAEQRLQAVLDFVTALEIPTKTARLLREVLFPAK